MFPLIAVKDWLSLVPPTAAVAGVVYMSYLAFCPEARPKPSQKANNKIRLEEAKVVDMIDIEDIAEKAAFCRCWKSNNVSVCPTIARHLVQMQQSMHFLADRQITDIFLLL